MTRKHESNENDVQVTNSHKNISPNSEPYGCIDGQPIIEVSRVELLRDTHQAVIENCPLCGETHRHGFDSGLGAITKGQSKPSHRVAHCGTGSNGAGGYYLIYTDKTEGAAYSKESGGWVAAGSKDGDPDV